MSTIDNFRRQLKAVPANLERAHIETVVHRFMSTYPTKDVATRVSVFAEELRFEDPAGLRFASNKEELEKFFQDTIDSGYAIRFFPDRLIVDGDEALQIARVWLQVHDSDPILLLLHLHFVFDSDGLVTQLRTFFDEDSVSVSAI